MRCWGPEADVGVHDISIEVSDSGLGPEDAGHPQDPSVTPVPNLFVNCGWGTGGFKATPGSANLFAHLIAKGEPHRLDLQGGKIQLRRDGEEGMTHS